ncbi:unnamed protein product [Gongylonema pulchrum]|uniref:Uncharacterized protein n=1 Tax=Gongylonema pulchrum TaxID=637853 RepID=A0A3P6SNR5_9BILA|nr:unnamed protein product [Gongylonema pulchrum]
MQKKIVYVKRLVPNNDLLKYRSVKDLDGFVPDLSGSATVQFAHYQLKFITTPGDAVYEVSVLYDSKQAKVTVDLKSVSHVNAYGDLPHCIVDKNFFLALYCVCYDKIAGNEKV